jgi:hypothetical protein
MTINLLSQIPNFECAHYEPDATQFGKANSLPVQYASLLLPCYPEIVPCLEFRESGIHPIDFTPLFPTKIFLSDPFFWKLPANSLFAGKSNRDWFAED